MKTQNIAFTEADGIILSDPIIAQKDLLTIHLSMEKAGQVELQRSITGNDWVAVKTINFPSQQLKSWEGTISGCVPGQQLRLIFTNSKPTHITVLQ